MSYDLMKSTIVPKQKTNSKTISKTNSKPKSNSSPTTSDESNYCLFDDEGSCDLTIWTILRFGLVSFYFHPNRSIFPCCV